MAAEPEGGQDGPATPAYSGVQLDTPDVGGEAGTAEQDRHLVIRVNSEHTNRMYKHMRFLFENNIPPSWSSDWDLELVASLPPPDTGPPPGLSSE